jgi:hypothetical protein
LEPFEKLGPLAEGIFRELDHPSFYLPSVDELNVDTAKLNRPDAAELLKINIQELLVNTK